VVSDKSKKVDKGKGKMVEPEKPKKTTYPVQTGGTFKIREPRPPSPPVLPIAPPIKKSPLVEGTRTEAHPRVARALKLADEESGVEKPIEGTPEQTPRVEASTKEQGVKEPHKGTPKRTAQDKVPTEESDVQVVEAHLIKRKKLKRGSKPTAPEVEPAAPAVETVAPAVKVPNVAGFLAARRSQAPPPSVPRVEEVVAFLANEPIPAVPVNAVELVEEPLVAPEGPIPPVLNRQLGSNI
jgi:hypothetical protein